MAVVAKVSFYGLVVDDKVKESKGAKIYKFSISVHVPADKVHH